MMEHPTLKEAHNFSPYLLSRNHHQLPLPRTSVAGAAAQQFSLMLKSKSFRSPSISGCHHATVCTVDHWPYQNSNDAVRSSTIVIQAYQYPQANPNFSGFSGYRTDLVGGCSRRFPAYASTSSGSQVPAASAPLIQSDIGAVPRTSSLEKLQTIEESLEKAIYRCRFMAFLGVLGSLVGSVLCFVKGCVHVVASFAEYFVNRGKVIMLLVEAIDVYLLGTVMLVFGTGLYELFISHLGAAQSPSMRKPEHRSNLFGLFTLKERPKWLYIKTVNELKTKLGHVIVMLLLIGFFEKTKKVVIQSPGDLLCLAVSVFLSSGCLFLLSKLTE